MEAFVRQHLTWLEPHYSTEARGPPDPEQTWLLGSKWADYGLAAVFAVSFPLLRGLLRYRVYEPVGRAIMFGKAGSGKALSKVQEERVRKWNESCWKLTIYILFTSIAIGISIGEPWFWDTRYFWVGCSHFPPCNLLVTPGMLLFYCMQTGFYVQAIHYLIFHEIRRKDWLESLVHHIATSVLLAYSYYVNFSRVGVMILLVHDMSDIFLEAAKLARYARRQGIATTFFVVFASVWIYTRNYVFPAILIRSTLLETLWYADLHGIKVEPHYTIFNALLLLLELLHIYWTYLILKIVAKNLAGTELRDIREGEAESDDDD